MHEKARLIRSILAYKNSLYIWRVRLNENSGADFVLGYCYDPKSEYWMTYENRERGMRRESFFETEEEALEDLLRMVRTH